jgi:hypothetical protein
LILTVYFGWLMLSFPRRSGYRRHRPTGHQSNKAAESRRHPPASTPMSAGATTLHALQMMTVAPDPQMGQRGFNL